MFGEGGDDTIIGGTGNDYMEGGGGADTFILAPGDGHDEIGDFNYYDGDRMDVQAYGYSSVLDFFAPPSVDAGGSTLYLSATDELRLDGIDVNSLPFDPNDAFIF